MILASALAGLSYMNHRLLRHNIKMDRLLLVRGRTIHGYIMRPIRDEGATYPSMYALSHNGGSIRVSKDVRSLVEEAVPDDNTYVYLTSMLLVLSGWLYFVYVPNVPKKQHPDLSSKEGGV